MASASMKRFLQLMSRRTFASLASGETAESRVYHPPSTTLLSKLAETSKPAKKQEAAFWMRDPVTGYWKPENHFGEVDAAELRAKLLPKKD